MPVSVQHHHAHLRQFPMTGPRQYFAQPTEAVDFVIVVLSLAANVSGSLLNLNMVRVIRCAAASFRTIVQVVCDSPSDSTALCCNREMIRSHPISTVTYIPISSDKRNETEAYNAETLRGPPLCTGGCGC